MKLWEKGIQTKEQVMEFTVGNDRVLDLEIAGADLLASMAHVCMLEKTGLINSKEKTDLLKALYEIYMMVENGSFRMDESVEDVHSQIEMMLTEKLGDTGKKVHTARSRNDQVITDLKLFYRSAVIRLAGEVRRLAQQLLALSEKHRDIDIPGYTHTQAAMPSSFGLWFGAYAESLAESLQVLRGAFHYINQNPLGSAAGYGSAFPVDRQFTTELLEFDDLHVNSVNAQMSRGRTEKILMSATSVIAGSLSMLATDMILFMSQNFNFMKLKDEFTTGSSIMPHKKNPDVAELIRAKSNRIQAVEFEIFAIRTNLTSGYHRDYQLLKEICFPAIGELFQIINMTSLLLDNIIVNENNTAGDLYKYLGTVDAMALRVMEGVPYREAYRQVAAEIASGKYKPGKRIKHSHIGSIGNPGNDRIAEKLEREWGKFRPEKYKSFDNRFIDFIKKECHA